MTGNSFGKIFCLTTFGESHGKAIGGIIDGCPPGLDIDIDFIQKELDRRKPGQSDITTQRKESDTVEILSGVYEGKSEGTPIGFIIRNDDQRSKDYENIKDIFRPSSADYTYFKKYGIRDYRGGGRASARETAARVVAGAVAKILLLKNNITINAFTSQIGNVKLKQDLTGFENLSGHNLIQEAESNIVRCPEADTALKMIELIRQLRDENDSIGGIVSCIIKGVPAGLGEPVFDKLHADLAKAMLSINACKGFDYGSGFDTVTMKGSQLNDEFINKDGNITTSTNYSGGIQGGISNGNDIYFRVLFKPASSIAQKQKTVDLKSKEVEIEIKGRHDPCVVPRAVPVVEAMAAITIADHYLRM